MEHHGATGPSVPPARWWGPSTTTVANADVMNQLCRVCGEPAAGFHFGAFTCEGCKSFFGRTYNNLSSVSECKNNGECVINKKNRTSCKACRLRKCLLVGMSKSGSRYGRRSNWFKIHCLLQEQQQQQQQQLQHQLPGLPSTTAHLAALHQQHFAAAAAAGSMPLPCGAIDISNKSSSSSVVAPPPPLWLYKDSVFLDLDNNNTPSASPFCPGMLKPPENASFWPSSAHNVPHVGSSTTDTGSSSSRPSPRNTCLPSYFISPFFQNALHTSANYNTLPFLRPLATSGFLAQMSPVDNITPESPTSSSVHSSSSPLLAASSSFLSVSRLACSSAATVSIPCSTATATTTTTAIKNNNNNRTNKDIDENNEKTNDDCRAILLDRLRSLGPVQECPIDLSAAAAAISMMERTTTSGGTMEKSSMEIDMDIDIDSGVAVTSVVTQIAAKSSCNHSRRQSTNVQDKLPELLDLTQSSSSSSTTSAAAATAS